MTSTRFSRRAYLTACLIVIIASSPLALQAQSDSQKKSLSVERIFGQPSLSGQLTRGVVWSPDGKQLGFFVASGSGKNAKTELWVMDVATGERRMLIPAEKLATMLPAPPAHATQATGLGRHAPSQYLWSPNGDALVFVGDTSFTWFDLKSQTPRSLAAGDDPVADVKISPDGRSVSFVRNHNVWIANVASGAVHALTQGGTEDVRKGELDWVYPEELQISTAYWWAPDSSAIAYLELDERPVMKYPIRDSLSDPTEITWERYPQAGSANPIAHVFVVSSGGGKARQMDTGKETNIYLPRVNWLPDSRYVSIQRLNREQTQLELLIADAANGQTRTALTDKDAYWIDVSDDLYFFHDSKRFLWSSERSGYRHLYLYNLDGTQIAQLTSGKWETTGVAGVDESKGLVYFSAREMTPLENHFYSVGLDGSGLKRLTSDANWHDVTLAPGAGAFVDMYSNVSTPPRQDVVRADGSKIAMLDENIVSELGNFLLSPVEFVDVKTHDGVLLNGEIIKPVDLDSTHKHPVIVYTYGGPHGQMVRNAWDGAMYLWLQMMSEQGFVIFVLDNRGSGGHGHIFEEPIHYRFGAQELSDQRDGVSYLRTLPFVDGARIGITGISYGGHMALHAMFEDPEDFKAGVAMSPVSDWLLYDTIYTERYLGVPQTHNEEYQESSPVKNAEHLKGKLLIAAGTGDDNVHFENTLEVLNELIEAGKYAETAVFPGRGHGISDPAARIVLMRRMTEFFKQNL